MTERPGRHAPMAVALITAAALTTTAAGIVPPDVGAASGAIHFTGRAMDFTLEHSESPRRYAPETMAGGVAVLDYDGDGDLDMFFANGAEIPSLVKTTPKYRNRLFQNDGAARFADVTSRAGLAGSGYDVGVAVGDYDNDGDQDLFVGGVHRSTLYRNNGDGTFIDVTRSAGLAEPDTEYGPLWSVGGAWLDANNDGWLDLFVTGYVRWSAETEPECPQKTGRDYCHPKHYRGTPNRLFLGRGDGTFTDASAGSGIRAHVGKGMAAAIGDADGDGLVDVFVTNDKLANFLFRSVGNGRFEETAFRAAVAYREDGQEVSGMGADFRDLDNDGRPDILFTALDNETFPLFRNTGNGYFDDATAPSRLRQLTLPMSGFGLGIFDFDNDGWKDVFVARGHVQSLAMSTTLAINQPNTVLRNLGNATFEDLTAAAGLQLRPPRRHRGSAHGDFNGDGRIDVVTTALGAQAELWMNDSPRAHHWLMLKLVGTTSTRDGIGAVVTVTTGARVQVNHMTTAVGYASASSPLVHFGLGDVSIVDAVDVRWPAGTSQRVTGVTADRILELREPARPEKGRR